MKESPSSTAPGQENASCAGPEETSGATHPRPIPEGEREFRSRRRSAVARLVAIYVVVSGAWILLSDNLVATLVRDPRIAQHVQTYKGWFFVIVTGALLGWLARRDLQRLEDVGVVLRESLDEMKWTQERMADALSYNRTILDASPVGLITCKATGEVISANEAAARIVGGTLEQVRAQSFRELESWRRYGLLAAAEKAFATRQEQNLETFMTSTFGKQLWLNLRFVPFQYAGAARLLLVMSDVTAEKEAQEAQRESEAKFRTLVEQSFTGVYIIQDNRLVYVNPGFSNIFGYSADELRNMKPLDVVREDDRERVAENLRKRLDNEVPSLHYSFRARHKDGRRLEVEVLGSRTELNGRPAIIGTALDITARKQAEEQHYRLATEKDHLIERLQLHFNAMPIGCIVTAPDLTVLDWNPAAESIFGFSRDEMVGQQPYGRIIPAAARELLEPFIAGMLRGNETRSLIQENDTKAGRRIFCEWHDTPLRDESGLVIGLIAMVQDVTERIKTETALRELSARLLAAQDEERRRIARELHDTTAQQLAALALNLSVISKLMTNPPAKVGRILAESLQLVETAAQEVRTTSYLLHPPLLEAAGLVGAVRDYASGFARRSRISVNLELQEDLGRLPTDAELALFRMVQEGLGNIHRHSGSTTATIRLARETDQVSLEMKDTGHGIPAETLAALQSMTGGVGVGIAGMRERLHQLKGGLKIESGPGGTTVRATLPISETKQTTS